ncbi:hypothetical protein NMYAN_20234 [Nitrosomonas nitrosa]|uniref:Uncharacterized protein n=1 Tax=Nitrosomonas nitrosa TaxID=52442 RepID=A0A8H9DB92_9PROT|nr:hypothetical protein NMYAN_20234 [Nitrosomonas nitrosa]
MRQRTDIAYSGEAPEFSKLPVRQRTCQI